MVDVLSIGSATTDVIVQSEAFKVYKDSLPAFHTTEVLPLGSKIHVDTFIRGVGGGAVNTATTFARQQLSVGIVTDLGTDMFSQEIKRYLHTERIRDDYIFTDERVEPGYSTILVAPSGERTVLAYRGNSSNVAAGKLSFEEVQTNWLYVTSLAGDVPLLLKILKQATRHGIKIALNPGMEELHDKRITEVLPHLDILLLNLEEAQTLCPKQVRQSQQGIFEYLRDRTKAIVVITNGTKGAAVADGRVLYYVPVVRMKVVDRLGAGDAFGSGIVAGLIRTSGDLEYALKLAATNAASVCAAHGSNIGIVHLHDKLARLNIIKHQF